eukprot:TRINITY_DN7165_c0_g1_i2.p1 TRINITY_DN7165_c0_g1~~TRINITY_DN7165_c0_g1_i2.p1  ORF type:complete len:291 (-),score=75.82 TRINITY_DN7165_c0_g1_i2:34-843(-)
MASIATAIALQVLPLRLRFPALTSSSATSKGNRFAVSGASKSALRQGRSEIGGVAACLTLASFAKQQRRRHRRQQLRRRAAKEEAWEFPETIFDKFDRRVEEEEKFVQEQNKKGIYDYEEPEYCCWVLPQKKAREIMKDWASSKKASEEQAALLEDLAENGLEEGWAVWALSDIQGTEGSGFYLIPPNKEPQMLCVVEAVDGRQNNIQHLAVSPSEKASVMQKVFADWVDSLRPKKVILKQPKELRIFGIAVDGQKQGEAGGAKVSKGI